jgi:hypothetical protein
MEPFRGPRIQLRLKTRVISVSSNRSTVRCKTERHKDCQHVSRTNLTKLKAPRSNGIVLPRTCNSRKAEGWNFDCRESNYASNGIRTRRQTRWGTSGERRAPAPTDRRAAALPDRCGSDALSPMQDPSSAVALLRRVDRPSDLGAMPVAATNPRALMKPRPNNPNGRPSGFAKKPRLASSVLAGIFPSKIRSPFSIAPHAHPTMPYLPLPDPLAGPPPGLQNIASNSKSFGPPRPD